MKAARTPLVTALVLVTITLTGCGQFLWSPGPTAPRFDPNAGTYTEHLMVTISKNDGELFVSDDPDATVDEFDLWDGDQQYHVTDDVTLRAYVLDSRGLRSPIAEAAYVINDTAAPTVASAGIWQDNTNHFVYDIFWEAWEGDPSSEIDPNPMDDLTDWRDLEFIVYCSELDNIDTLSDAEENGTLVRDWISRRRAEKSWNDSNPNNDLADVGWATYQAAGAGERRFINVFVRDQEGNVTAYGSNQLQSRLPPADIFVGRAIPPDMPDDEVWINPFDGGYDPPFNPSALLPPGVMWNTYTVMLADLDDDGFDDLIVCYNDGATTKQGWFRALGNGSFDTDPEYELSATDVASEIVVADMDQDGSPDIVMGNVTTDVEIYNLDFSPLLTIPVTDTDSLAVGDINGDGYPDVVTADLGGLEKVKVWINDSGTSMDLETQSWSAGISNPTDVVLARLSDDDYADLVVSQSTSPDNVEIFYGSASGVMDEESEEVSWWMYQRTLHVDAVDWNQDGWTDLIFANDTTLVPNTDTRIYFNLGDTDSDGYPEFGSPMDTWGGLAPAGIAVGDLNGDEWPDFFEIIVASPGRIWLNSFGSGVDQGVAFIGFGTESTAALGRLR